MTILCDFDLIPLLEQGLILNPHYELVNPASIDICIGRNIMREVSHGRFERLELTPVGIKVEPGEFLLVETEEIFSVPNGYAMDLRLKSSSARSGWDHSLAFWVDPGWHGKLTMEIRNVLQYNTLQLVPGTPFAQAIVHRLSGRSAKPYEGRYNGAVGVEGAKPDYPGNR